MKKSDEPSTIVSPYYIKRKKMDFCHIKYHILRKLHTDEARCHCSGEGNQVAEDPDQQKN
jgi:hypothetical protein